jgi:hypothetical protein
VRCNNARRTLLRSALGEKKGRGEGLITKNLGKAREDKTRQENKDKARQGKKKQGKVRQGKTR